MKLETVRKYTLSLEGVHEEPHHHMASFRTDGKIFVTIPPDAGVIHVFLDEADRDIAFSLYPDWAEKLIWGQKVRGVRISLSAAQPAAVKALIRKAYTVKAKKR